MDKNKSSKLEKISKEVEVEQEQFDVLDVLLDKENHEPIVLENDKGERLSFEQIAVIPRDDVLYAILKPIDKIPGIADDEAVVFWADESASTNALRVCEDEKLAISIFEEYYDMLEESKPKTTKKSK